MRKCFYISIYALLLRGKALWRGGRGLLLGLLCIGALTTFAACTDSIFGQKKPVVLNFWHVYGAQAHSPMNSIVCRFNQTEGKARGIVINVTAVSNAAIIHEDLVASAKGRPGSATLPDIFTCYPKTVMAMGNDLLMDWKKYFSQEELQNYVPSFLKEGEIDGKLKVFPLSKSTNILFVNSSIFDCFSRDTGIRYADLATWEGMYKAAERYYTWSKGKAFFMCDDWIHYAMLNTEALGEPFFKGTEIRWESPALFKVWKALAEAAGKGYVCLMPGYATKAMMMGEAVCGVESSASILYFKDTVTFSDNSTLPLKLVMLPEPRFAGAKKLDIQRGIGLCALAMSPEKEEAAAVFCKWLTEAERNLRFVLDVGYMPVRKEAFAIILTDKDVDYPTEQAKALFSTLGKTYETSHFFISPHFESYGALEKAFAHALRDILCKGKRMAESKGLSESFARESLMQMQSRLAAYTLQEKQER